MLILPRINTTVYCDKVYNIGYYQNPKDSFAPGNNIQRNKALLKHCKTVSEVPLICFTILLKIQYYIGIDTHQLDK